MGRASDWKARGNAEFKSPEQQGIFLSESTCRADSLTVCPYSPCVQSHASTSVCTSKIQNTGCHTSVWTHECLDKRNYYAHWLEWVALLLRLLCLTWVRRPEFPTRDKELFKKQTKRRIVPSLGTAHKEAMEQVKGGVFRIHSSLRFY